MSHLTNEERKEILKAYSATRHTIFKHGENFVFVDVVTQRSEFIVVVKFGYYVELLKIINQNIAKRNYETVIKASTVKTRY